MNAFAKASVFGVCVALVCVSLASAGSPGTERVRLVDATPVTLQGLNFHPLERITISLSLGSTNAARALRAGSEGRFLTVFPKLRYDRCHGALSIKAVGNQGSRANWRLVPLDCPDSRADS
jgi:hypothetical protein